MILPFKSDKKKELIFKILWKCISALSSITQALFGQVNEYPWMAGIKFGGKLLFPRNFYFKLSKKLEFPLL